jgi:hypothetical protein
LTSKPSFSRKRLIYCPLVAGRVDIDETAKTEAVQSFAAQVSKLLY